MEWHVYTSVGDIFIPTFVEELLAQHSQCPYSELNIYFQHPIRDNQITSNFHTNYMKCETYKKYAEIIVKLCRQINDMQIYSTISFSIIVIGHNEHIIVHT